MVFCGRFYVCQEQLYEGGRVHHAFPKLQSSLVSYTIDAGYAIAYALDNIDRCTAEQGF